MTRPSDRGLPPGLAAPRLAPDAPSPGTKLPSHYEDCFGCGADHPTGLHLTTTVADGVAVRSVLTVAGSHQGAPGLAHGGLLSAAFDEAMGNINWLLGVPAVTGRLETEFLRPVPVGTALHIHAWCEGTIGRKVFLTAEGRLGQSDGRLAVRAAAVFVQVNLEHFSTHGRSEDVIAARESRTVQQTERRFEVNP